MKEQTVRLGPREQQIVELLLQGCDNAEIASQLKMARRTVKAHFNRLFLRFGITGGIKRVKLATLLYRRQACQKLGGMELADAIGTTEHVVKNYLRVIYDKLGLWNRVELALWYESRRIEPAMMTQ
jgi:DNA-binding NarL/FixJ family response regulator